MLKRIILFSLVVGILSGAGVAAVSEGSFWSGWLAASVLACAAILLLALAWRWAGGGRTLAALLAVSFALRLVVGIGMSLGLQRFGYDEVVQRSGYVYADAFSRDQDAWKLASSAKPIWASFQQDFLSDQYGGSLALSALVYRGLSPDAHRRFLILILTAFAFSLGLPFFWKAVRQRWNEPLAWLAGWVLVLYPESLLVGASQMREPFLLGLTMIAFWATLAWRSQRRLAVIIFLLSAGLMFAFSSRAAIVLLAMLLACGWIEHLDEIVSRRWRWLGWASLGLAALALVGLSWGWLNLASSYDAGLAVRQSGMVQKLVSELSDELRLPFITAYGLAQPVLPAALVDPAPVIWKTIAILRSTGWWILAPFLLYAIFSAWRAQPPIDRRVLIWLSLGAVFWLLLCSMRAGGDQWDNPRYRVLFLPFMAILIAWGWRWSRERRDIWVWAWVAAEFVLFAFFLSWYISRYTGIFGKLPFWVMLSLILGISIFLLLAGLAWNFKRQGGSLRAAAVRAGARLREFVALGPGLSPPAAPQKRLNRWDAFAAAAFLAFALLYFLGRLQSNYPITVLSGDAGNLVSFAAAQDRPDLFIGDAVLGENNRTGYYATLHIPLIRALSRLTGGDYVWAFVLTLAPTIFIQLLGFYIFGRVLFRSRFYAFLLAFLTAMPFIWNGIGEFWGIWRDALPRVTFQAVLPYLLALAVAWRSQPRRWPWLMILSGLMVFLHSISTPAVGFAIWLGLWLYLPKEWKALKRLGVMVGLGLLFLLALSPFALNFLSYQARGASPDYDLVMTVLNTYVGPLLMNPTAAFAQFATEAVFELLLPIATLGFYLLWRFGHVERALVALVLTWFSGVMIVTLGLTSLERVVESALRIPPIDTELVRGMRYLPPLLMVFWLWPLAELAPRFINRRAFLAAGLVGVLLLGGWTVTHTPEGRWLLNASLCLARGQLVCGNDREINELIVALRQTPPGSRVWYFNESEKGASLTLAVRYLALRPLVYSDRDSGLLVYTDRPRLESWLATKQRVEAIQALTNPTERMDRILPLAGELHAEYLALDFPISATDLARYPVEVVMQNKSFTLLKLIEP